MNFLLFSFAANFLVLAASANKTVPIDSTSTTDSRPRTAAKVWNPCGSNCPLTCANPKRGFCNKACKADFFCPSGYFENSVGQCVVKDDCDNLQPIQIDNPVPLPRPFPRFPSFRPLPRPLQRPCQKPLQILDSESTEQNLIDAQNDIGRFAEANDFQAFEPVDAPLIKLSMGPARPKPVFEISPVNYNATAVANGAPIPPPAVVRTSGSNAPLFTMPAMVPKSKHMIDLDPTVPRPVLRVSKEQSSENEN